MLNCIKGYTFFSWIRERGVTLLRGNEGFMIIEFSCKLLALH